MESIRALASRCVGNGDADFPAQLSDRNEISDLYLWPLTIARKSAKIVAGRKNICYNTKKIVDYFFN